MTDVLVREPLGSTHYRKLRSRWMDGARAGQEFAYARARGLCDTRCVGGGRSDAAMKAVEAGTGVRVGVGVVVLVAGMVLLSGCVSCGAGVEVEQGTVPEEPVDAPVASSPATSESSSRTPALDVQQGDCDDDDVAGADSSSEPTTVYYVIRRDCDEPTSGMSTGPTRKPRPSCAAAYAHRRLRSL